MQHVVVREYARLTTTAVAATLDRATITESAFGWLCTESARLRSGGASLVELDDVRWLRLDNYVGVIETPCGTQIDILPKHVDGTDDTKSARLLLQRMLARCLDVTSRETAPTSIEAFNAPLSEWVMRQFLRALDRLVKRGIRFDYLRIEDEQRFLRGRLDMTRQLRQPPGRQHRFQIQHDVFEPDRPENRLLKSALERVRTLTHEAENWRLAHELASLLAEVPASGNLEGDLRAWRDDRLMAHYRPLRPWCELILRNLTPLSVSGRWRGLSLLFPMEQVFERYVGMCLRDQLLPGARIQPSASSEYLCRHKGQNWFLLKPDFLLTHGTTRWVLDTKWKRLDASRSDTRDKYGLSQSDFYQLYAYGQRYLNGEGDMCLIYPASVDLQAPLPVFEFSPALRLWVLPFDLVAGRLLGAERTALPLKRGLEPSSCGNFEDASSPSARPHRRMDGLNVRAGGRALIP